MAKIGNTLKIINDDFKPSGDPLGRYSVVGQKIELNSSGVGHRPLPEFRVKQNNIIQFSYKPPGTTEFLGPKIPTLVNPTTIKESIDPQYAPRPVLGLSHEVVQYVRTASRRLDLELYISYYLFKQTGLLPSAKIDPLIYRNFWHSLCVPWGPGLPPPLVACDAPNMRLFFVGVVDSLDIEYQQFNSSGEPVVYTISLSLLEAPENGLMSGRDVMQQGIGSHVTKPSK